MSITSTQPVSSSNLYDTPNPERVTKRTLGQDDFLKLLTVQLTQQDPLKPTDNTDSIAQMAQFSSLQQASQMARDMSAMRTEFSLQSASNMIGRNVTIDTKNGPVTGVVDSVNVSSGDVSVGIGGSYYPVSQVVQVAPVVTTTQS